MDDDWAVNVKLNYLFLRPCLVQPLKFPHSTCKVKRLHSAEAVEARLLALSAAHNYTSKLVAWPSWQK